MRQALTFLILAPLVMWASLVTAAVTTGDTRAQYGPHYVYIKNEKTGSEYVWRLRQWPTKHECEEALGNSREFLAKLADETVKPDDVPELDMPDVQLGQGLSQLILSIFQNTGLIPTLSIRCDLPKPPTPA